MSNFPIAYILTWLPMFLSPSIRMRESFERNSLQGILSDAGHSDTITLVFFGDIANVSRRPIAPPTNAMLELFRRADLVVGNCETPVVNDFLPSAGQRLGIRHGSGTQFLDEFLDTFQLAADKLYLSIANNHALDCGRAGLIETIANLEARGITVIGRRETDRPPLTIAEHGGLRIGLASWTHWLNGTVETARKDIWFAPDVEGVDWLNLKRSLNLDTLCALPHWDFEFRHVPQPATRARAAQLAQSSVDLIVGHHPHVLQPIERHGRALCAYSLGDLMTSLFRWHTWPTRIFGLLEVDIVSSGPNRGSIGRFQFHPWVRAYGNGREEYKAASELDGALRKKVEGRLRAVFPADQDWALGCDGNALAAQRARSAIRTGGDMPVHDGIQPSAIP